MTVSYAIWLLVVNTIAWLIIHFGMSFLCLKIPLGYFLQDTFQFRIATWEQNGKVWDRLFAVKRWKKYLIDGSSIVKKSYNKKHLHGTKCDELKVFAAETKRAEMTHWLILLPIPLFFLWNPLWAAWINVAYAFIANVPFIITQRFNRARIEAIVGAIQHRK